jgi:hypothetical protein
MNILIIRAFVKLRDVLATHKDLAVRMDKLEATQKQQLKTPPSTPARCRIGFRAPSHTICCDPPAMADRDSGKHARSENHSALWHGRWTEPVRIRWRRDWCFAPRKPQIPAGMMFSIVVAAALGPCWSRAGSPPETPLV